MGLGNCMEPWIDISLREHSLTQKVPGTAAFSLIHRHSTTDPTDGFPESNGVVIAKYVVFPDCLLCLPFLTSWGISQVRHRSYGYQS